jgi:hypothetical protein
VAGKRPEETQDGVRYFKTSPTFSLHNVQQQSITSLNSHAVTRAPFPELRETAVGKQPLTGSGSPMRMLERIKVVLGFAGEKSSAKFAGQDGDIVLL